MKILFINPASDFLINKKVFPSLGLLYLSAYLKKYGYEDISLIDMNDENPLQSFINADIVGFYSNTPQFPTVIKIVKKIKKINRAKNPLYVLGGPHVSGKPKDGLNEFDIVVAGEGERALLDIVRNVESHGIIKDRIVKYDYIDDIDKIPFPDRDLIDMRSYKYYINDKLATTVVSSRGCPFCCTFCANNAWGKTIRMRSSHNIFEEIKMLKDKYGYGAFMFFDDTMTVSRKRMERICELLKVLKIIYRCFIRSDTVDGDILKKMRESGCVEIGIGIESGSQRILNIVNKGTNVKKNMEIVKLCHNLGIRTKGFFMVGLPGENKESIKQTADFLRKADLDDIDVTIHTPYPGSLIYENKEKFDITFKDDYGHAWYKGKPGFYRSLVSTSSLTSAEILKARDELEAGYKKRDKGEDNMLIPFVDLRRQYKSIKKEIDSAVGRILKGSNFILGKEVEEFEEQFANYIGVKYAVGVGSGTGALHMALLALGIGKGDEVIIPANTYIADALAVEYTRAMFNLCDVDDDTSLLNADVAKKKINIDTKAAIFVHLYGQACDIKSFGGRNIKIVEDCAQSTGCIYKGQQTGSRNTGCFSFYPAKNLGCMGDGGAVTTNDNDIYTELLKLRNYGSLVKYHHELIGYNCRLDTLQAAILSVKLKHLDKWNEQRKLNAVEYANNLIDCEEVTLPEIKTSHIWHLYVIRVAKKHRDSLVDYLRNQGIGVQFHYPIPIHKQWCFKDRGLGSFPTTERLSEEILSLPMFPELTKREIRYICIKIKEFFANKRGGR